MNEWSLTSIAPRRKAEPQDEPPVRWEGAKPVELVQKKPVSIRLDEDLLDFFKSQGKGYQTRINAVLRAYMEAQKR